MLRKATDLLTAGRLKASRDVYRRLGEKSNRFLADHFSKRNAAPLSELVSATSNRLQLCNRTKRGRFPIYALPLPIMHMIFLSRFFIP
jgi:hypothetical protein